MRSLVLHFEDAEFEALKRLKGGMSWRDYVLRELESEGREAAAQSKASQPSNPPAEGLSSTG